VDENLELVRRVYEVMAHDLERFLAFCDPEIAFINPDDAIESGVRHGFDGVRTWFAALGESFESWRQAPVRMEAVGDRVAVETAATMVGRATGLEVDTSFGHVWTLRDGKVLTFEWFREPQQAFEAVGLDETS
jgi:ketosteroid isomerase-like protein